MKMLKLDTEILKNKINSIIEHEEDKETLFNDELRNLLEIVCEYDYIDSNLLEQIDYNLIELAVVVINHADINEEYESILIDTYKISKLKDNLNNVKSNIVKTNNIYHLFV